MKSVFVLYCLNPEDFFLRLLLMGIIVEKKNAKEKKKKLSVELRRK